MRPNVLLVVLDTARRDAVEPYAQAGHTPALADLARRGRALEHAYATSSWTLPSHASMFTGLLPRQLGLGQPPDGTAHAVRPVLERFSERFITSTLQRAGYATRGFSTNLWVSDVTGFDRGFDDFRYVNSGRDERMNALLGQGRRALLAWAREGLQSRSDDGAAEVGRALRDSIASWSGQPTFWFVNLSECHSPYLPPRPWNDLPPWDRARAALDNKAHLSFHSICMYIAGRHEIPRSALHRMRHLYDRAIAYMDSWLAGVLEALDARGILDDTLVIVTSDHGENFGENGLIAHGFSLDERLIHVPAVLAGPGADIPGELFSLAGLPRMIADAAGIDPHPWGEDEFPEGAVISQFDSMAAADSERARQGAAEHNLSAEGLDRLCARFTIATNGRHKLVVRNERELFFDLVSDPLEEAPVDLTQDTDAVNGAVATLRAALEHPAATQLGAPAPEPTSAAPVASAEELAEIERKMQLLGYM